MTEEGMHVPADVLALFCFSFARAQQGSKELWDNIFERIEVAKDDEFTLTAASNVAFGLNTASYDGDKAWKLVERVVKNSRDAIDPENLLILIISMT